MRYTEGMRFGRICWLPRVLRRYGLYILDVEKVLKFNLKEGNEPNTLAWMKESDEEAYAPPKPEESGIPLRKPLTVASDATHPRPLLVEVHAESPVATPKETGETGPRSFAPPVPEVGKIGLATIKVLRSWFVGKVSVYSCTKQLYKFSESHIQFRPSCSCLGRLYHRSLMWCHLSEVCPLVLNAVSAARR